MDIEWQMCNMLETSSFGSWSYFLVRCHRLCGEIGDCALLKVLWSMSYNRLPFPFSVRSRWWNVNECSSLLRSVCSGWESSLTEVPLRKSTHLSFSAPPFSHAVYATDFNFEVYMKVTVLLAEHREYTHLTITVAWCTHWRTSFSRQLFKCS